MSRKVYCVRVPALESHPNADTLDLAMIWGTTPVLVRRGEFTPGGLAAFWEIGTVHPEMGRIKAKRLRGVFSMGMLTPLPPFIDVDDTEIYAEGADITTLCGAGSEDIDSSDLPGVPHLHTDDTETCPHPQFMRYLDIEDLRKNWHELRHGETLHVSEKVHGTSARYMHDGERLWVGSRNRVVKCPEEGKKNLYWDMAPKGLEAYPFHTFCGEIYGPGIQRGFHYGRTAPELAIYDIRLPDGSFSDWHNLCATCLKLQLGRVHGVSERRDQTLSELEDMADNPSLYTQDHVREGVVVRVEPVRQWRKGERAIFKLVSRKYLEVKA